MKTLRAHWMKKRPEMRARARHISRIAADESGQILPWLVVVMIGLLAGGVIVFWLGFASASVSGAQTAADAAALAGEQELVSELSRPPLVEGGQLVPPQPDWTAVQAHAESFASSNDATVTAVHPVQDANSTIGWDLEVQVRSGRAMPSGSVSPGSAGTAWARASTDPFAQASPSIQTSITTTCDAEASTSNAPLFVNPPSGAYGFFPNPGVNYTYGCEPRVAGALNALALKHKLHLTGELGYAKSSQSGGIAAAHACGAAMRTAGLDKVLDPELAKFGLTRRFPTSPDEIELSGNPCETQTSSQDASALQASLGNSKVHLVPMTGGPQGSALLLLSAPGAPADLSQLQIECTFYAVGNKLHVDAKVMLAAFEAGWDESNMTNITHYTPGEGYSLGVLQQQSPDGWGTPAEETNPEDAVMMFFAGDESGSPFYNGFGSSPGAIVEDQENPGFTAAELAQSVQGSFDPSGSNYANQLGQATSELARVKGGACSGH